MPVLLLARGDQPSRLLLRHAIEARYGLGPPALDTLKIDFKGRVRAKIGPVVTWMPLEGTVYCKLPFTVRWNYTTRPAGVALRSGAFAFDGTVARRRSGGDVSVIEDAAEVESTRARLWTISALLLTPLAEHFVELRAVGERAFDATNDEAKVTARLQLHEDHTLESTSIECLNPANGTTQAYTARVAEGQKLVGDLILPSLFSLGWDNQAEMELAPLSAQTNPPLEDSLFRLESG